MENCKYCKNQHSEELCNLNPIMRSCYGCKYAKFDFEGVYCEDYDGNLIFIKNPIKNCSIFEEKE